MSAATRESKAGRFNILSLDGGGLKGIFSASVLAELESDLGIRIADHFDLIVGTSTGGIIALGLGAGLRPADIVDFYLEHGPGIFGHGRSVIGRLRRPKHDHERLRAALVEVFGDRLLGSSSKRLVIPSYSLDTNDVYVFKTPHHTRLRRDWKETMVDVAMATTAAPTFLPASSLRNSHLVDGGVWANNPALVATTEARSLLDVPLEDIRILSLGTTEEVSSLSAKLANAGLIGWGRTGASLLLHAQAVGSFHVVEHLIGPDNVTRIDSLVPAGLFGLDRVDATRLRGLAENVARVQSPRVASFTTHTPAPYVPTIDAEAAHV